ncbi:MAG TPA: hypothetical protein VME45_10715 [Stellaceae bacterium]|nr:hypothetical protein [Stellaceae bacterium]
MKRTLAVGIALGVSLGMTGLALAQPAYGPNATYYYPSYAAPPPPAVTVYPPVAPYPYGYYGSYGYDTSGRSDRAYWGSQKTN